MSTADTITRETSAAGTRPVAETPKALAGVRILELANVVAGPTAGQILGDFGAEVIKIENPDRGDPGRYHGLPKGTTQLWWKMLGRNKRSVSMYLGDPEVAKIFLKLVETADVVVEGFRPGTLEKWGLGYDELCKANPNIILARLSGFGQVGPYARRPAFGTNIESMTGLAQLTGHPGGPPTLPTFALSDYFGGLSCLTAILIALYYRDANGGTGQEIDCSLFLPLMTTLSKQILQYDQLGRKETRIGNRSTNDAPRNAYRTKDDKWVGVSAATGQLAARTMVLVGRPDLAEQPWIKIARERVGHAEELDKAVADWVAAHTRDEVIKAAEEAAVTIAPMYEVHEMLDDPHVRAAGFMAEVDDPDLGKMRMPNVLFRMSKTPGRIRWTGPTLGEATEAVLGKELGVNDKKIAELRDRGVVR